MKSPNPQPNQSRVAPEQARAMAAATAPKQPLNPAEMQATHLQTAQAAQMVQTVVPTGTTTAQPMSAQPVPAQPMQSFPQQMPPMQPTQPMTAYSQMSTQPAQPMQSMPAQPAQFAPAAAPVTAQNTTVTAQNAAIATNQGVTIAAPQVTEDPLSTQSTLLFSELRDGLVIMKDGSFRAVVACQSINFDLMSEQEREAVEYSYQNFLNSLNFTIQILVRSQRVDIGPYIEKLTNIRRNNDNMLLGILMDDYIGFIDELAREANIMDKSFFIVIPYYPSADLERAVEDTKNFFKAMGKNKSLGVTRINRDVYDKAVDELNNRVESVISGLYQIGIQSIRLRTRELSQLFYNFNNPDTAVREPLVDFSQMATTFVRKGTKNG